MRNRSTIFLVILLICHVLVSQVIPVYIFPEIAFSSYILSITDRYVSEDHFLHPWLIYYVGSYLIKLTNIEFAFRSINIMTVVIIDLILYILCKKKFSANIALLALSFYIPWQIYFRGNSLWFDILTIPFILISYIHFQSFINKPKISSLLNASIILSLGYFFKQTILWIAIVYFCWLMATTKYKLVALIKYSAILVLPLAMVILLNSLPLLLKATPLFTIQWSFFIPIFIYPRLPRTFLAIDEYYLKIIFYLIILLVIFSFHTLKYSRGPKKEIFLLLTVTIVSLCNIFPRWSDFRVQPFLVFLCLNFAYLLSIFTKLKNTHRAALGIFFISLLLVINYLFLLKINNEWKKPINPRGDLYAINLKSLFRDKSIFLYDSPAYQGNPEGNYQTSLKDTVKMVITNPDKYYRTKSSQYSLDQVKNSKVDIVIVPSNIFERLNTVNDLVDFEKYIITKYEHTNNIGNDGFIFTRKVILK